MADIKVRFELNENANEESIGTVKTDNLTFANTSIEPNAAGVFNNMPTRDNTTKGINALTFGQELYFNENGMLDNVDNYGGGLDSEKNKFEIVWGVVNSDNTYNVKITFENAVDLKDIVIYGDKESKQFPTRAILDSTTEVFSDDYIWTLQFPSESDTHTIEFTHWNRANYNAVLTFIGVMLRYIEIDKRNGLKSVESLSQSTGQPKEIFYGVVPSSGYIEVIDVNGEIGDMVKSNVISNSNVDTEIWANKKMVQKHISTDSEYNINTKIFSANMTDTLAQWENITAIQSKTSSSYLYTLLKNVLSVAGYRAEQVDKMCDTQIIYGNKNSVGLVKDYLSNILVRNSYNETSNVKKLVEDICVIAQLNVFQNDDGEIKFISARPVKTGYETIWSIPKKYQFSTPQIDFVLKNKYSAIKYKYIDLIESVKEVFSLNATIKDKDGNLDLESVGSNVRIITEDDGISYLCFIKQVTNYSSMFTFQNVYSDHNIHPVQITTQNYEETISSISKSVGFDYSQSTIDEYDFSSYAPATILSNYSGINSETIAFKIELNNENKSKISIKLFGIVFDRNEKFLEIGEGTNQYEYNFSNSWLKSNTHFIDWDAEPTNRNINIYDIITRNIITDYLNGINTMTLTIGCANYYDINKVQVKNWVNGEILQVGDIVRVDEDNYGNSAMKYTDGSDMYFKVTGRTFRKQGVPLIDLELQEVKVVS